MRCLRRLISWASLRMAEVDRKVNPQSKPSRKWAGWTTNHGRGACLASGRIDAVLRPNTILLNVNAHELNWCSVVRFRPAI